MSDYSEAMKSEDASTALRKFTEDIAEDLGWPALPPQERFYENLALLVCPSGDGWAIGLRVDFTPESWAITEVVAVPAEPVRTLPKMDTEGLQSYVETAVSRARRGSE